MLKVSIPNLFRSFNRASSAEPSAAASASWPGSIAMRRASTLSSASAALSIPAGQIASDPAGALVAKSSIGDAAFDTYRRHKPDEMLLRCRAEVYAASEPQAEDGDAAFA